MALKAVLFDLDGTLLDTAPDFVTTLNLLRNEEGHHELPRETIRQHVSNGARALIKLGFNINPGEENFDRLLNRLLEIYADNLAVDTVLFPGIDNTLKFIHNNDLQWGIVTNKAIRFTAPILEALNIQPAPVSVVCPDHVENTKPHPDPLHLACRQINCSPSEIIYVGDHLRDIDCGKAAGSKTIAAAYGYLNADEDAADWNADHIINHADELLPIIEKYLSR